ncbi:MAG: esterase [Euryarchaeota archaeon]|nr:esterase [Euryarchaeota archaeon]MDE1837152.1 esterase [Euryarchaeota archaeon]MDE1881448.1 esterase [Euryarchaeota archaeon]MDE2046329.1 esterase [Thermoplasmata archaeon]
MKVPLSSKGPRSFPDALGGRATRERIESQVLRDNPLGDPTERSVAVYTPPSGRTEGKPLVLLLSGFTGAGWMSFREPNYLADNFPQHFDRLIREKKCGEAVVVAPDCLTTIGGSQYVNSTATGPYEDYLLKEVLPWAREKFRTGPTGVMGQSSGGFGALHLALDHPEIFQASGSSSGDMAFEYCYLPDFPKAVRTFRKHGGPEGFLAKLFADPLSVNLSPLDPSGAALNAIAMAACYSPRTQEPGSFDLPFDVETGELLPQVWDRWRSFDPIRRVSTEEGAQALRKLRLVHVTASTPDEWTLDVGARWFFAAAKARGVPVAHDEFEGGHAAVWPRYEAILSKMVAALSRKHDPSSAT